MASLVVVVGNLGGKWRKWGDVSGKKSVGVSEWKGAATTIESDG